MRQWKGWVVTGVRHGGHVCSILFINMEEHGYCALTSGKIQPLPTGIQFVNLNMFSNKKPNMALRNDLKVIFTE